METLLQLREMLREGQVWVSCRCRRRRRCRVRSGAKLSAQGFVEWLSIGATKFFFVEWNPTGATKFQSDLRPVPFGNEAPGCSHWAILAPQSYFYCSFPAREADRAAMPLSRPQEGAQGSFFLSYPQEHDALRRPFVFIVCMLTGICKQAANKRKRPTSPPPLPLPLPTVTASPQPCKRSRNTGIWDDLSPDTKERYIADGPSPDPLIRAFSSETTADEHAKRDLDLLTHQVACLGKTNS